MDAVLPGASRLRNPPAWPPDTFAIAATVLARSGGYVSIVERKLKADWPRKIRAVGKNWRRNTEASDRLPVTLTAAWLQLTRERDLPVAKIIDNHQVCSALLELVCAADEASVGIGVVDPGAKVDDFELKWPEVLYANKGKTLCRVVNPDRVVVLPKLHTPRSGITLRSLTHNLALYEPGEVGARWHVFPRFTDHTDLKILLLPWPLKIASSAFRRSNGTKISMPEKFGFFTCNVRPKTDELMARVQKVVEAARKVSGRVDAIVFPEAALVGDEYFEISKKTDTLVIAGVGRPAGDDSGRNEAAVAIPAGGAAHFTWKQSKHHRWRVDKSQIGQYGLGKILDAEREWWEDIRLEPRRLNFLSMNPWLTLSVLICEDLARMDPVTELVRSVGPTLVVALLLDGPQLAQRWPARYATVLADDPGTSVLTLTSAGMVDLSRPVGMTKKRSPRVIALWKDAKHPTREISLDLGADGVLLEIGSEKVPEWTADGRDDGGTTAFLIYKDTKQIRAK
jgi:hypothetical protein